MLLICWAWNGIIYCWYNEYELVWYMADSFSTMYVGSPYRNRTFFFLICCFTYNLIKLVSFKVLPSTLDTPLPTFLPVLERVLELVLRDGAKVPCQIFFSLFYRLKSATFQSGFQLWEQEKVHRDQIWRVGRLGNNSRFMLCQKFMDKEWCVSWCTVMVQHPGVVYPRLRPLPSHCHPQTLQNV